jgi:hypothetical protein
MKKWKQGAGWGWVWGKDDEIGALNEMTDQSRSAALRLGRTGQGLRPGHHLQPPQLQVAGALAR